MERPYVPLVKKKMSLWNLFSLNVTILELCTWFGSKLDLLSDEGPKMGIQEWWKQNIDPKSSGTPLTNQNSKAWVQKIWWAIMESYK